MIDWKKMKNDISHGIKEGAEAVAKKAEEVSDEGQRKLKVHNLKKQIRDQFGDLGSEIYNAEKASPGMITHEGSMKIIEKIETLSRELKELEK